MNDDAKNDSGLAGMRILMVEDEMLLAMSLKELLERSGCHVIAASSISRALAKLDKETIDGALLDVNLGGERSYPVAEDLERRKVPFIFMTGYDSSAIDERWRRDRPIVHKPFDFSELARLVAPLFGAADR